MKSNADYWKGRFQQLEKSRHIENGDKYREIEKQFMRSQQAIESKINAWYGRFASNNGVTLEEARKMLNASELKELKWDVEDYIKAGKQNALSKQFQRQLENASAKYHISRLEAIKLQTQMECEKLYGNFTDTLDEHIKNQYADAYYKTAFELQKGIGYGHSMERINSDVVEQVINKPWAVDGKNFATRLGESKVKLINNVHNSLTKMCLMGSNPDQAIKDLAKTMQGDRARAGRIIMTESAYFSQNAQKRCFNALNVDEYEIVATLDSRTCDSSCAGEDGKHYPMKMFEPGVTAPPFHPRCRCCTAPYFNDEWSKGERAARDEDGNTYYVPSDMKYNDWYKAFVDDDTKLKLQLKQPKISKNAVKNSYSVNRELVNSKAYHDKFDDLTTHKMTNEALHKEAITILEHRNNTDFEDLAVFDYKTGNLIVKNDKSNKSGATGLTKEQYDKVKEYIGEKILLHNHPNNSRPSYTDIKTVFDNEDIKKSVIVGHEGDVYVISDMNRKHDIEEMYKQMYNDALKKYQNKDMAEHDALTLLCETGLFKIERR